jgi:hypothetical protein
MDLVVKDTTSKNSLVFLYCSKFQSRFWYATLVDQAPEFLLSSQTNLKKKPDLNGLKINGHNAETQKTACSTYVIRIYIARQIKLKWKNMQNFIIQQLGGFPHKVYILTSSWRICLPC